MKIKQFEKRIFWKSFLPSLICYLGLAISAIVDSIYIGNTWGESGLFILGATSPVYMIFNMISVGLAAGGTVHFSALMSEGKVKEGNRVFFSVTTINFVLIVFLCALGLCFTEPLVEFLCCGRDSELFDEMLQYVRLMLITSPVVFIQVPLQFFVHADNEPKRASMAMAVGCVVDCVSGFIFIMCLDLGVNGSIYSTICGAVVMEIICLSHILKGQGGISLKMLCRPNLRLSVKSFYTGFASAAQYLYQFVIIYIFNRILFELRGEVAVAIFDLTANANSIIAAVLDAMVLAITTLVSSYFGEKNAQGVHTSFRTAMLTGLGFSVFASALMFVFSAQYCLFSGLSEEYIPLGVAAFGPIMCSLPIACINTAYAAYFQSIGSEKKSYVIMALRSLLLLLVCAVLFAQWGYNSFWWCYLAAEVMTLAITFFMIYRMKKHGQDITSRLSCKAIFSENVVGSVEGISECCGRIQNFLEKNSISHKTAYLITLSIDEMCRLISENADSLLMQMTLILEDESCTLHIRDNARNFNPMDVSQDDDHGIGLRIVKKQATDFYYRQYMGFNTLTVVFDSQRGKK